MIEVVIIRYYSATREMIKHLEEKKRSEINFLRSGQHRQSKAKHRQQVFEEKRLLAISVTISSVSQMVRETTNNRNIITQLRIGRGV